MMMIMTILKKNWILMIITIPTRALCMVKRSTPVPVILIIGTRDMKLNDTDTWKKENIINIARGTTDPGYWVYNLNHVSD